MLRSIPKTVSKTGEVIKKSNSKTEDLKLILYDDLDGIALLKEEHMNKLREKHHKLNSS
jgi:hypothetical protein